ncbi:MAG TPA: hypothetical protein PKY46_04585 [Ignavibacteriaceae bacterium]|nr:hypothetical protein [Ignavibacteriaceae bacterium]
MTSKQLNNALVPLAGTNNPFLRLPPLGRIPSSDFPLNNNLMTAQPNDSD